MEEMNKDYEQAVEALVAMEQAGELPEGLALESLCRDGDFAALIEELPAKAAVRVYAAEKAAQEAEQRAKEQVLKELDKRRSLPKAMKSNRALPVEEDYMNMSPEAFKALERALKRQ